MKRKAQGAIEYLFMIAAALIIILIVVRQLKGRTKSATNTINSTGSELNNTLNQLNTTG
jgi:predicted PurR-regulated permease PerM